MNVIQAYILSTIVLFFACGARDSSSSSDTSKKESNKDIESSRVEIDSNSDSSDLYEKVPEFTNNNKKQAKQNQGGITLKDAYREYFPIGAAVLPRDINNNKIADFIKRQYSSVTPANHMKPTYIQPKEGQFQWRDADLIANFAKNNGLKLRGHTLVWPQQMPKWMYRDGNKVASKNLLLKRLKDHISAVVSRYRGNAYCWDVVNEAIPYVLDRPLDKRVDSLLVIGGKEYIEKAFIYAHEADPKAKLFYNDNSFEWKEKRDGIFSYLKKLKEKGIPIDGVGLQAHWGLEGVSKEYLQETIDMFASIGLEVQLTELDISIYPKRELGRIVSVMALKSKSDAYSNLIRDKQAQAYKTIFEVCRQNKGKITGVTLWSAYDWDNYLTKKLGKKNYPYLFDEKLVPKKAYYEVVDFRK